MLWMQENREILQEEDKIKLETEAAKAPIDHTTLQLHNLLYEKNHYVKAIKTCKDFRSKYSDIDLVSEEAFFQDAPPELQSDPALRDNPHKLMIQRLKFELHQVPATRTRFCDSEWVLVDDNLITTFSI